MLDNRMRQSKAEEANLSLVSMLTIYWYYTSPGNTIFYIQQLMHGYTSNEHDDTQEHILFVFLLTSLQILLEICISFLFLI